MDYLQNTNGFHYSVLNINGKRKCFVIVKEINLSITKHLTFLFCCELQIISTATGSKCARQELARASNSLLLQQSRNVLGLSSLKLTISSADDKSPFVGVFVSHRELLTASHSNKTFTKHPPGKFFYTVFVHSCSMKTFSGKATSHS